MANGNDTVSVISTKDYTVVSTVAIDSDTSGGHVVAVTPSGTVYVTDAVDRTVRVLTITRGNTAPVTTAAPTVGTPDLATGAVSGDLNLKDPDGDALGYTVTGATTTGTVTVDPNGAYTFTPTQAARDAAATPSGAKEASFTVTASDGHGGTTTVPVTVTISRRTRRQSRPPRRRSRWVPTHVVVSGTKSTPSMRATTRCR